MKRAFIFLLSLTLGPLLSSCEQPTMLSVSQTALSFENKGGNQSVTLTANKVWTASSNQGWLRVSPSSGEGNATLSVSCEGNTTYDTKTGTITIVSEELTQTISVTQAEGLGLLISQPEYNLSNEAQTIDVTVQANVQYTVDIDNACRAWIKQESTKGLSSNIIKFAISKNESYDGREGKITIRQTNGSLSATVTVKQNQQDGLFVEGNKEYSISYEEQAIDIVVKSNMPFEVEADEWITVIQTKGLELSTVSVAVAENKEEDRVGTIVIKGGSLQQIITIKQKTKGYVQFEDNNFEKYCIGQFDLNRDGQVSYYEASLVDSIDCHRMNIQSLMGIEYFISLSKLICYYNPLECLDISHNLSLEYLDCRGCSLNSLDISHNTALSFLNCCGNYQLSSLDISNNKVLSFLDCAFADLSALDISNNTEIAYLRCSNNKIARLDVSNNLQLDTLYCDMNRIGSLDFTNNNKLSYLNCDDNRLTALNLGVKNELKEIRCSKNQLKNIDVRNCPQLDYLDCGGNEIGFLDLRNCNRITNLDCYGNKISSLDVSNLLALKTLSCSYNPLYGIDVSLNTDLLWLNCDDTRLETLDVSRNKDLQGLSCMRNSLKRLDVSSNNALVQLNCSENQLEMLEIGEKAELKSLYCNSNQLRGLDVSGCPALSMFDCRGNPQLVELWLKTGQIISPLFGYNPGITTIKYKD